MADQWDTARAGYATSAPLHVDSNGVVVPSSETVVTGVANVVTLTSSDEAAQICDASSVARTVTITNIGNGPVYIMTTSLPTYFANSSMPIGIVIPSGETLKIMTSTALYAATRRGLGFTYVPNGIQGIVGVVL
jgi:hypothetical protein